MVKQITALALLAFTASEADAKVYLSLANQTFETSSYLSSVPLKLNGAGLTTATFALPASTRVLITFSAECKVGAALTDTSIKIVVDGVAVPPTASGRGIAFCDTLEYGTNSVTVSRVLAAGTHTIRVFGNGYAAGFWYTRYSTLNVYD